jgi:hypothetical protein
VSLSLRTWTFAAERRRGVQRRSLPLDHTANPYPGCRAVYVGPEECPYFCTRQRGHSRRHAAGDGTHILAVWP